MQLTILSIFLSKKIFFNFLGVFVIFTILIFGNQLFIVSKESIKIGLETNEILPFVFIKYIGDLTEALSISFLVSVVVVFLKFKKSSEKVILRSAGQNDYKIFRSIFPVFIPFTILLVLVSFFISPMALHQELKFKETAKSRPSYIFLKENQFQEFDNLTFYSPKVITDKDYQQLSDVFILQKKNDQKQNLITSKMGYKIKDPNTGNILLDLRDGNIYENLSTRSVNKITHFDKYSIVLFKNSNKVPFGLTEDYRTYSIFKLFSIDNTYSKGEIYYRLSQILIVIIASYFAIISNGINPRSKKNYSVVSTLVFYIFYFNFVLLTKSMIENKQILFSGGFLFSHLSIIGIISIIFNYHNLLYFSKKYDYKALKKN